MHLLERTLESHWLRANKQTSNQTIKHTNKQTNKEASKQTNKQTNTQRNTHTHAHIPHLDKPKTYKHLRFLKLLNYRAFRVHGLARSSVGQVSRPRPYISFRNLQPPPRSAVFRPGSRHACLGRSHKTLLQTLCKQVERTHNRQRPKLNPMPEPPKSRAAKNPQSAGAEVFSSRACSAKVPGPLAARKARGAS